LSCALCGRKQSAGILSRRSWGEQRRRGKTVQACPLCRALHPDWAARLAPATADRSRPDPRISGRGRPQLAV